VEQLFKKKVYYVRHVQIRKYVNTQGLEVQVLKVLAWHMPNDKGQLKEHESHNEVNVKFPLKITGGWSSFIREFWNQGLFWGEWINELGRK